MYRTKYCKPLSILAKEVIAKYTNSNIYLILAIEL